MALTVADVLSIVWLVIATTVGLILYRKTENASVRVNGKVKALSVNARIGGASAITVVIYVLLAGGNWWLKRPQEASAALNPQIFSAFIVLNQSVTSAKAECTRPGPKDGCGLAIDAIADRVGNVRAFLNASRPGTAPP